MDGLDIRLREEEVYREFPSFLGVGSVSDGEDQPQTEEKSASQGLKEDLHLICLSLIFD